MKSIIKNIPNILTILRILLTPFIIYLSFTNSFKLCIILIIIASLTDLLDGLIARTFNLVSTFGAKLDTIADKLFGGCLAIALIPKNILIIFCLVGEILIATINVISYFKGKYIGTKFVGKIKTTCLFITVGLGFLSIEFTNLVLAFDVCIFTTFALQMLCSICYLNESLTYKVKQKTH